MPATTAPIPTTPTPTAKPAAAPLFCPPPRSRRWIYILLLGAWGTMFFGILRFSTVEGQLRQRELEEASLKLMQTHLETRLAELEQSGVQERLSVEAQLKDISSRQDQAASTVGQTRPPFPIDGVMRAVVQVVCIDNADKETYYSGSGTVIDGSGLVLTNRHLLVSKNGSLIKYCGIGFTSDLKEVPSLDFVATVLVSKAQEDLALLRISERVDRKSLPTVFPALSLTGSATRAADIQLGDAVYIAGYPDVGADTFTFTQGVVSGRLGPDFIKTSALVDSGASGGAGVDGNGRFIGVPTAAAKGEIGGSLGYLISAETVDTFMSDFYGRKR